MNKSKIKLCVDCQFIDRTAPPTLMTECLVDEAVSGGQWLVTGEGKPERYSCHAMRAGICGTDAKHFKLAELPQLVQSAVNEKDAE